jgi:hypothetical protein
MRTSTFVVAAGLAVAIVGSARAQQAVTQTIQIGPDAAGIQLPPGMMPGRTPFKTGSGRLRGRVLQADGSGPVRRAQVRLQSPESGPKSALTDGQGRFEFRDLPGGRYSLSATKSGFMNVQYGQTRPFESGKPLDLADKQALDNVDIAMPRGGAISGRIVDEFGEPLPDATVSAMRLTWSNGKRRLTPVTARSWPSDDRGHYRIYGLAPGEYYVSATSGGGAAEAMMVMSTVFTGGEFFGGPGPANAPTSGYAPTYFPGTPNAAEAQKVTVTSSQESSSVDFQLTPVRLVKIAGFVMTSEGRPAAGTRVALLPANRDLTSMLNQAGARTGTDGSFTMSGVAPGDYVLQADPMQITTSTSPQGDNMMVFRAARLGGEGGDAESGMLPVSVGGEDLLNVTIVTTKGARASGRVTFDSEPRPALTGLRVISSATETDLPGFGIGGSGGLKEDATFELTGLFGRRLISVTGLAGWRIRTVKLNGLDITDAGAEFKVGETYNLEVELTQRASSISGGVTASDSSIVKDYTAVVFAENPELWRLPRTRYVSGTRPAQDGRFKITNMPPGNYYAVAVDYIPTGEWGDPELLDRLKSHAKRFTLDEGGTPTLDLKVTTKY